MKAKYALVALFGATAASAQGQYNPVPYNKSGVANCALPGTTAEFFLDGTGRAKLVSSSSNYAGFREAARRKTWTASILDTEGTRMLVLDNQAKSRIMVKLPTGNGMAFLADGGVSDIICQVLVSP